MVICGAEGGVEGGKKESEEGKKEGRNFISHRTCHII